MYPGTPLVVKGGRTIVVSGFGGLNRAIRKANETGGYITILLADGEYLLNRSFAIRQPGITIKGQSGNRDAVIVRGKGYRKGPTIIFRVSAAHFTIADLTIGWVRQHAIQIKGENGADYPMIHNLRIVNTGEQMVKVTAGKGKKHRPSVGGVVQWSEFGFTEGVAPRFYTGGIDAHGTKDWIVRNNVFKNIRSPEQKVAEHAIHFWNNAQGTIVEGNTIINSDRGIGFGLSKRTHLGGVIRNNMVHTTRDVGIGLENASDAKVYNNTVFTENYHNSNRVSVQRHHQCRDHEQPRQQGDHKAKWRQCDGARQCDLAPVLVCKPEAGRFTFVRGPTRGHRPS